MCLCGAYISIDYTDQQDFENFWIMLEQKINKSRMMKHDIVLRDCVVWIWKLISMYPCKHCEGNVSTCKINITWHVLFGNFVIEKRIYNVFESGNLL